MATAPRNQAVVGLHLVLASCLNTPTAFVSVTNLESSLLFTRLYLSVSLPWNLNSFHMLFLLLLSGIWRKASVLPLTTKSSHPLPACPLRLGVSLHYLLEIFFQPVASWFTYTAPCTSIVFISSCEDQVIPPAKKWAIKSVFIRIVLNCRKPTSHVTQGQFSQQRRALNKMTF